MSSISFNPAVTSNAAGSFNVQSDGYTVGSVMPDPTARNALAGGVLALAETLPMFGGVGISESLSGVAGTPDQHLGPSLARAAANANLTGFSVFDQAHAWINTPQSPVPVTGSGGLVNFFRLGSGIRIPLAIDPALVSLEGGLITQQVSWDFTNQKIIAYSGGIGALPVKILDINVGNSLVPVYNSGTGFVTWNRSGSAALVQL